jgi:hypothetical protein
VRPTAGVGRAGEAVILFIQARRFPACTPPLQSMIDPTAFDLSWHCVCSQLFPAPYRSALCGRSPPPGLPTLPWWIPQTAKPRPPFQRGESRIPRGGGLTTGAETTRYLAVFTLSRTVRATGVWDPDSARTSPVATVRRLGDGHSHVTSTWAGRRCGAWSLRCQPRSRPPTCRRVGRPY